MKTLRALIVACCFISCGYEEMATNENGLKTDDCNYQEIQKCMLGCNEYLLECVTKCPFHVCHSWNEMCKKITFTRCIIPCWPE